ncbi:peptidylprolyl isomerase [Thiocapsa roseopersicina]|uniref:Chaperone SurA n=1 Tax=Thiocapsa roseopersicina TaxID=1058 RepID=A0A1H2UYJ6_THIRO|nr:peptidylprolyl isomerase [Thiocapsa roseopersicina]SDW61156.1 periplasmic chaperone for outer membrane proteins SurA [Thiocapsa roseopersicina]
MVITRTSRGHHRASAGRRRVAVGSLLACLLIASAPAASQTPIQELDAIIAVVNDDVVVRSELDTEIDLILPQMQKAGTPPPPRPQLEKQVLDRLILKRLQAQRARDLGIQVEEATLNEALTNIAQRNGLSLEELQATLEAGGIRFADFREDTRSQIVTSRLQNQEVVNKIQITDQEIDRFLERESSRLIEREQVRLQHILIALPENATPAQVQAAEAKAARLVARLRGGEDFAKVAAAESDGRNALQGGDLGWFEMGAVPSLVSELAFTMAEGDISDPLSSPSGYHIIKLNEIKAATPADVVQTNARHILVRTNELVSDDDAKRRLEQLRMRIVGGEDFATLARSNSDDTGSALKGGDLGWVNPGDTVPDFEEAMNALPPNGVSEPFQSPFGWHIVQVIERRNQDKEGEFMRIKAREALQRRKAEEATEEWLRQLRDEAYVEIRLDEDAQQ